MRVDTRDLVVSRASDILTRIKTQHPLVHNITNYVVMNFTANVLLALGAAPVMSHAQEEVEEMVGLAGALVINIGTLSAPWVDSMVLACRAARELSVPVVLDPVGAGATRFRTETAKRLIVDMEIAVVRGNASEILALSGQAGETKGVDSVHTAHEARDSACDLARTYKTVVAVTGKEDFVTDGERVATIANGHALMGRITGTGCASSAIVGAFCALEPDCFIASVGALLTLGIAGELAAESNPGPGTFQTLLLDRIDGLESALFRQRALVDMTGENASEVRD